MQRRPRTTRRTIAMTAGLVAAAAFAGWLATSLLDGPWGMLPGGRLVGPAAACEEAHWEDFASEPELELEVRPSRPRSVTTWNIVRGGELFIPADFLTRWKRWPLQVQTDDRIRLRIGGQLFECRAERVEDDALIEELRVAIATKYDLPPDGRAATVEVWWFRVMPR